MVNKVEARLNGQRHKTRMDIVKPQQVRDCKMERNSLQGQKHTKN